MDVLAVCIKFNSLAKIPQTVYEKKQTAACSLLGQIHSMCQRDLIQRECGCSINLLTTLHLHQARRWIRINQEEGSESCQHLPPQSFGANEASSGGGSRRLDSPSHRFATQVPSGVLSLASTAGSNWRSSSKSFIHSFIHLGSGNLFGDMGVTWGCLSWLHRLQWPSCDSRVTQDQLFFNQRLQ